MYKQHVAPQTQNQRTNSLILGAKRRTGAKIATFGLSALVAGQLLLPGVALATEMLEPVAGQDVAAAAVLDPVKPDVVKLGVEAPTAALGATVPTAVEAEPAATPAPATAPTARGVTEVPGGGEITINATVVDHYYDLELPPAFMLIQDEAFVYDFPDKPEDFPFSLNKTVYFFKIDPDNEALVKTENPEEASVSITLVTIDNHVRATVVFTGGDVDPQIPYRLDLFQSIYLGTRLDHDSNNFDGGQGTTFETQHKYYIRCIFNSDVHLITTDTTAPEVKPDPTRQPEAEKPAADPASAETALPATGDNGAMAVALGAAGAAVAAAAGVIAARRRNR